MHGEFIDRITSPNGRWVEFTNDTTAGTVTQIRDNLGRTVSYAYDAQRLHTVTDAGGGVTTYTYHALGAQYALIETITDARQIVYLTNVWDLANRRVTRQTLADGGAYQFAVHGGRHWVDHADGCDGPTWLCPSRDLQCLGLSADRHVRPRDA